MTKKKKIEESKITPEVIDLGEIGGKKIISSVNINDHEKKVIDINGTTFIIPIE